MQICSDNIFLFFNQKALLFQTSRYTISKLLTNQKLIFKFEHVQENRLYFLWC